MTTISKTRLCTPHLRPLPHIAPDNLISDGGVRYLVTGLLDLEALKLLDLCGEYNPTAPGREGSQLTFYTHKHTHSLTHAQIHAHICMQAYSYGLVDLNDINL